MLCFILLSRYRRDSVQNEHAIFYRMFWKKLWFFNAFWTPRGPRIGVFSYLTKPSLFFSWEDFLSKNVGSIRFYFIFANLLTWSLYTLLCHFVRALRIFFSSQFYIQKMENGKFSLGLWKLLRKHLLARTFQANLLSSLIRSLIQVAKLEHLFHFRTPQRNGAQDGIWSFHAFC